MFNKRLVMQVQILNVYDVEDFEALRNEILDIIESNDVDLDCLDDDNTLKLIYKYGGTGPEAFDSITKEDVEEFLAYYSYMYEDWHGMSDFSDGKIV